MMCDLYIGMNMQSSYLKCVATYFASLRITAAAKKKRPKEKTALLENHV